MAERYYRKAIEIGTKFGSGLKGLKAIYLLANLYEKKGMWEDAEQYYTMGVSLVEEGSCYWCESKAYGKFGHFYAERNKVSAAEVWYREGVEVELERERKNYSLISKAWFRLGCFYAQYNHEHAEECCRNATNAAIHDNPFIEANGYLEMLRKRLQEKTKNKPKITENLEEPACQHVTLPSYKELVQSMGEDPMDVDPPAEPY